jgi:hypothetical protein
VVYIFSKHGPSIRTHPYTPPDPFERLMHIILYGNRGHLCSTINISCSVFSRKRVIHREINKYGCKTFVCGCIICSFLRNLREAFTSRYINGCIICNRYMGSRIDTRIVAPSIMMQQYFGVSLHPYQYHLQVLFYFFKLGGYDP